MTTPTYDNLEFITGKVNEYLADHSIPPITVVQAGAVLTVAVEVCQVANKAVQP